MKFTHYRLIGLETIDLPVKGAELTDSYIFKGADGFGPVEIQVSIANGKFQNREPQKRQIVFLLGLNPNHALGEDAQSLREKLYSVLSSPEDGVTTVQVMDGNDVLVETAGFVSKIDPTIFDKNPAVQITIECVGSYLVAPAEIEVDLPTLNKATPEIINPGSAPVGFSMGVQFSSPTSGWAISSANNYLRAMDFQHEFQTNDLLIFNTQPGSREIFIGQGLNAVSKIGALTSESTWLELHKGANTFVTSSQNFNWVGVSFTPQYWGL